MPERYSKEKLLLYENNEFDNGSFEPSEFTKKNLTRYCIFVNWMMVRSFFLVAFFPGQTNDFFADREGRAFFRVCGRIFVSPAPLKGQGGWSGYVD
jgi:hypothetical protein